MRKTLLFNLLAGTAILMQAPEGTSAAADGSAEVPITPITIQGLEFEAPQPYKAGPRELTEGEASALNQTLAENLRNNFAPKIKAAIVEFRKANGMAEDAEVAPASLDHDALIGEFEKYAGEYEFGVRKAGGVRTPTDPILREAHRIAWDRVKIALTKKNIKIDSVSKEKKAELIEQVVAKYPEIKEEATRRVNAASGMVLEDLGI